MKLRNWTSFWDQDYKIRHLTEIDIFSRFSPIIDPRLSYRAKNVLETLDHAWLQVCYPQVIRVHQCSKLVSRNLDVWASAHDVTRDFFLPGKSTDNVYIDAFDGRLRAE